jgi:hypothetical protein
MVSEVKSGDTVLTGRLEDRSAVFGVVARSRRSASSCSTAANVR